MTIIYILIAALFISPFILYRMLVRMVKYQNFKSNVYMRVALEKDFKEYKKLEEATWKRDEIVKKISKAIDDEIDESPIWDWDDITTAINAETFFRMELSEPFHRAFSSKEIIERHKERNKEFIERNRKKHKSNSS